MKLISLFVLIPACIHVVYALECGISVGSGHSELKKLADSCTNVAKDTGDKNGTTSTTSPVDESANKTSEEQHTTAGPSSRIRRAAANDTITTVRPNYSDNSNTENSNQDSQKCVVQCIFEKLEMTDDNGFPDYSKVSEGLLKKAQGRELRDFLQETADTCFQTIKDDKSNACQVSTRLIKCLAEKGRSNCGDWPVGELPFQMNSGDKMEDADGPNKPSSSDLNAQSKTKMS